MKRVLILDDSPEILTLIRLTFKLHFPDYDVVTAMDGETGLHLLETVGPFDLVITDWMMETSWMKGVGGDEVARRIRLQEGNAEKPTRILLQTAKLFGETNPVPPEFDAYMSSPFTTSELTATIKKLLDNES